MNTHRTTVRRRRFSGVAAAIAALGIALTTAGTADAAVPGRMNPYLLKTTSVTGTNCSVTTSMWMNDYKYPGAAAYVSCGTAHTVAIAVESDWAPESGGSWQLWGRSPATAAGYGTRSLTVYETWQILGGSRQWRGVAYVWIDGVYRGWADSQKGTWTAGT